jgi:Divergent InlB B-repeat domain
MKRITNIDFFGNLVHQKKSGTRAFRMPASLGALLCVAALFVSTGKTFSQVTIQATVKTNPTGRSFTVDGTTYTATQTFSWVPGSSHTIATTSPQSGGTGVQYVWSNWSDHGAISHTVAPTANVTYTATFKTQYLLTMSHGTGGTVSPRTGWKNSGTVVSISATPNSGFSFSNWTGSGTGSYSGPNNPASITMGGPITETATFTQSSTPTPTPTATFTPTPTATATATPTPTAIPTSTPTPTPTPTPRAAVLYVASGTSSVTGILYTIDPANPATFTTVGTLNDVNGNNYPMAGLKYHPITGIFYGATANALVNPNSLVTVDPATAFVTVIGPFGGVGNPAIVLTDIAIDPTTGIMYGISGFNQKFYTINTTTGLATQSGSTGIGFAVGGGFASDSTGALFGVSNLSFYSFNKTTGLATLLGSTLLGNLVRAADFSQSNVFYGLEGGGGIDNTHLRWLDTCDVTTGNCTRVGQIIPQDLDALAFIPQ